MEGWIEREGWTDGGRDGGMKRWLDGRMEGWKVVVLLRPSVVIFPSCSESTHKHRDFRCFQNKDQLPDFRLHRQVQMESTNLHLHSSLLLHSSSLSLSHLLSVFVSFSHSPSLFMRLHTSCLICEASKCHAVPLWFTSPQLSTDFHALHTQGNDGGSRILGSETNFFFIYLFFNKHFPHYTVTISLKAHINSSTIF